MISCVEAVWTSNWSEGLLGGIRVWVGCGAVKALWVRAIHFFVVLGFGFFFFRNLVVGGWRLINALFFIRDKYI